MSSDRLLAGVEGNEGAVESECDTLGEDPADDVGEFEGSIRAHQQAGCTGWDAGGVQVPPSVMS